MNKFTDCSFKIENRILNCHKLILAASSPVFEAMFYGKFSYDKTNSIAITDINYDTFELFMDYIYTGELKLRENDEAGSLIEISYCAQKYLIDDLRKVCLNKLAELINREKVFKLLAKSFEHHLEDFLISCLYYFVDSFESGTSFCNTILNLNESSNLSSPCFEFLVKNLLDYFGGEQREDILCLIKSWTLMEKCHSNNISILDSMAMKTNMLNLDDKTSSKILNLKAGFFKIKSSDRVSKSFHRTYYKPVRPLIIDKNQMNFDVNISFKRFVIVNCFMINSRLIPEKCDIQDMNNQTYVEKIEIEIVEKCSNKTIYKQKHSIENVAFNNSFEVKLNDDRMVLFPHHVYVVKFLWNVDAIGFEYPRCIFSLMEKGNDNKVDERGNPVSIVQFHEYIYNFPVGSIVQGIFYDIIS